MKQLDWAALACVMGDETESIPASGRKAALRVISVLLGEDTLLDAHRTSFDGLPGSETARSVLLLLKPACVEQACLLRFRNATTAAERLRVLGELRGLASPRTLPLISELLTDTDPVLQRYGATILQQLYFDDELSDGLLDEHLQILAAHRDPEVRETGRRIQEDAALD